MTDGGVSAGMNVALFVMTEFQAWQELKKLKPEVKAQLVNINTAVEDAYSVICAGKHSPALEGQLRQVQSVIMETNASIKSQKKSWFKSLKSAKLVKIKEASIKLTAVHTLLNTEVTKLQASNIDTKVDSVVTVLDDVSAKIDVLINSASAPAAVDVSDEPPAKKAKPEKAKSMELLSAEAKLRVHKSNIIAAAKANAANFLNHKELNAMAEDKGVAFAGNEKKAEKALLLAEHYKMPLTALAAWPQNFLAEHASRLDNNDALEKLYKEVEKKKPPKNWQEEDEWMLNNWYANYIAKMELGAALKDLNPDHGWMASITSACTGKAMSESPESFNANVSAFLSAAKTNKEEWSAKQVAMESKMGVQMQVVPGKDIMASQHDVEEQEVTFDDLEACVAKCKDMNYGGFVVSDGTAYFKSCSADAMCAEIPNAEFTGCTVSFIIKA